MESKINIEKIHSETTADVMRNAIHMYFKCKYI